PGRGKQRLKQGEVLSFVVPELDASRRERPTLPSCRASSQDRVRGTPSDYLAPPLSARLGPKYDYHQEVPPTAGRLAGARRLDRDRPTAGSPEPTCRLMSCPSAGPPPSIRELVPQDCGGDREPPERCRRPLPARHPEPRAERCQGHLTDWNRPRP